MILPVIQSKLPGGGLKSKVVGKPFRRSIERGKFVDFVQSRNGYYEYSRRVEQSGVCV